MAAISLLKRDNQNYWMLLERFAEEAKKKDVRIVFVHPTFNRDEKPYVGLSSKSVTTFLDSQAYERLFIGLANAFLVRSATFSKPTPSDLSTLEFWMAKESQDDASDDNFAVQSYKPYFVYRGDGAVTDNSGNVVGADRLSQSLIIRIFGVSGTPSVQAFWRDPTGAIKSISCTSLSGMDKAKILIRLGIKDLELNDDL